MIRKKHFIISILFIGSFMVSANIIIVAPILKFIKSDLLLTISQLGIVLSIFPFVAFFSNIIIGPFVDKYGRREMILIGAFTSIIAFFLTSISNSPLTIIIFRGLTGVFVPMVGASIFTYVVDYFPVDERMKVMGYVTSASFIAQITAIPLSILVSGYLSWRYSFCILSFSALVLFSTAAFFLPTSDIKLNKERITLVTYKNRLLSFSKDRNIVFSLVVYSLVALGMLIFAGLYPTWIFKTFAKSETAYVDVAVLFLIGGTGGLIGSSLSGKIASKFENRVKLFAFISIAMSLIVLAFPALTSALYFQYFLYVIMSTMGAMRFPILQTLLIQSVVASERGSFMGVLNATFQISSAAGAAISAYLYLRDEMFYLNVIAVAISFMMAAVISLAFVKEKVAS